MRIRAILDWMGKARDIGQERYLESIGWRLPRHLGAPAGE